MTPNALETFHPHLLRRAGGREFAEALSSLRASLSARPAPAPQAVPADANALIEEAAAWVRSQEPGQAAAMGVLVLAAARAEHDYLLAPPTHTVPDLAARMEKLHRATALLLDDARRLIRRRELRRSELPRATSQRGDAWCSYVDDLATFLLELEHPDVDRHAAHSAARQARELLGARQAVPGVLPPTALRNRALDALGEALAEARAEVPRSGVFETQSSAAPSGSPQGAVA